MEEKEADLWALAEYRKTKDRALLGRLLKKHTEGMFGLAFYYLSDRDTAMDVVMDSFEVALKSIDEKEITNLRAWLMAICRNLCLKQLRDKKYFEEINDSSALFMENESSREYSDEQIDLLMQYIRDLKPEQRNCVTSFYLLKHSYEEISKQFGYPIQKVKSYIQNGKRNLALQFERNK